MEMPWHYTLHYTQRDTLVDGKTLDDRIDELLNVVVQSDQVDADEEASDRKGTIK